MRPQNLLFILSDEHNRDIAGCYGNRLVDPDAVNARALADQERKIALHGVPEAIRQRGDFGYTPAPGQTAVFG